MFVFKNKKTGMYKASYGETDDPSKAYPKIGDRGSAFLYIDEHFESQPDAKARFRNTYEYVEVEDTKDAHI